MKIHNLTICEDARVEVNGKFILLGVYGNEINIPMLPANFNFLVWLMIEHEASHEKFGIRGILSDREKEVFHLDSDLEPENPSVWTPVGIGSNVQLTEECTLTIEAQLDSEDWHALRTIRFVHQAPQTDMFPT